MSEAKNEKTTVVGAMKKRRVAMSDGRRYLIYYTFGNDLKTTEAAENNFSETEKANSVSEEKIENV